MDVVAFTLDHPQTDHQKDDDPGCNNDDKSELPERDWYVGAVGVACVGAAYVEWWGNYEDEYLRSEYE